MVARLDSRVKNRMNEAQHVFPRGRSTGSAWRCVRGYVQGSECKYVLGVFVDFVGAFDNLERLRVIEKLESVGCEEMSLWRSNFQERSVCMVRVNVVWRKVEHGCPQGSICGPFIWNT